MAQGGRIDYTVGFKVDKTGLTELQKELAKLQNLTPDNLLTTNFTPSSKQYQQVVKDIEEVKRAAAAVGPALQKSFNPRLNVSNIQTFTSEINKTYGSVDKLFTALNKGGIAGQQAAAKLSSSFLTAQTSIKKTETVLDKMGTTLMNTVKWTFSSSIINRFTGAISSAVGYVKHLDSSLNDIRIVTGKSADEMERFAVQANNAAKQLGKTTTDYTEASLIYYQQGLSDQETAARTATTLKAANVTGQSTAAVSEELTAVWNGYKVGAEQTEAAIDKLAAVAATTAADLQELSTGMSKVASAANAMGVDMDQLNAQIATIISVTRQAPETVGTALKTIYARMADLKLGDTDEDGLGLGDVSGTLEKVGISVLDVNGDLRDLGTVIEEVAAKWDTWTSAQQTAIAQVMAGKRQYNNLVALFENWDMYSDALETSQGSLGTLQKQQDIYMESTTAHINQLKAQWEDLYDSLLDADTINGVTDFLKNLVSLATSFIDTIGGGKGALTHIIGLLGTLFSGKIASGISEMMQRFSDNKALDALFKARQSFAEATAGTGKAAGEIASAYKLWGSYAKDMTDEQREQAALMTDQIGSLARERDLEAEKSKELDKQLAVQKDLKVAKEVELNQAEKDLQLEKEKGAERLKNLEQNLAKNHAVVPDTTGTRGKRDYSASFTKTNLSDYWNTADEDIKQIKKDLDDLINTSNQADKAITAVLKKQPSKTLNEKGNVIFNPDEWKAWSKSAVDAINKAETELKSLKQAGLINDEEYNRLTTILGKSKTKDGVDKRTWAATKEALVEIKDLAHQTGNEFSNIKKVMGEEFDASQYNSELEAIDAAIEKINADKAQGVQIDEQLEKAILAQRDAIIAQTEAYKKQQAIQTKISLASGLMQLGNTYSTISNLSKQFADGQASLSNILSGVGSTLMTTTMIASNFKKVLSGLGVNITKSIGLAWTGVGVAVAAAVAGISFALEKHQKALEADAETAKNAAETHQEYLDKLNEEKDGIDAVIKSYKELKDQIADHSTTVEDARDEIYELCKQHNLQDLAVQALTADYEKLGEVIDKAQDKINEGLSSAYKEQAELQKKASKASIKASSKGFERDTNNGEDTVDLVHLYGVGVYKGQEGTKALANFGDELGLDLQGFSGGHIYLEDLLEAYAKDKEGLYEIIEEYNNDDNILIRNLSDYISQHKDDFEAYREAYQNDLEQENLVIANQTFNKDNIKDLDTFIKEREKLSEALSQSITDPEELKDFVNQYINGINEIKEYTQQADIQDAILGNIQDKINSPFDQLNLVGRAYEQYLIDKQSSSWADAGVRQAAQDRMVRAYQGGWSEDQLNSIINTIKDQGLSETAAQISSNDWVNWYLAGYDEDKIVEMLKDRQSRAFTKAAKEFNESTLPELNKSLASVMSDVSAGEDIDTSSEDYLKMQEDLKKAVEYNAEAFKDLDGEVITFFNDGMVGTEQWIQSAYKLQQVLDGIEFDTELKEYTDALHKAINENELEFKVNDDELQETLENIMNEDYDISVKIHSEAEEDFENIANSLDRVDELADKIGEDFIVAADDIRALNNAFPGILEGMEYMADGTIKLNEDIVKSAMDTAAQESAAAVEATETRLKASAAELRAKAEIYEGMAKVAQQAADGAVDAEDAKVSIVKDLMDLESQNNEAVENQKIDNANAVVDNTAANAPILAQNWDRAYQEATNAVNEWASVATEANAAVASGATSWSAKGNFGHTFTGQTHTSSEGAQAATLKSQKAGEIDWGSLAASYTNQATTLRAQANDIEGMIATLGAKAVNTAAKTGGVGAKSGSGSGGGSSKDADHEDYLEREEDVYREINEQLDQIESTLGRIQTINDHEWGYDAQKTLEKENDLLDQQLEKLEKKKELQVGDLSYRRKQLELEGVQFSEDGSSMANAEAVLNGLYAHYNQMVDMYNAMSAAEQETYKATLEAEKDRIDKIEGKIDAYESLYSDYQSTLDSILDAHFAQIENTVKQFNNMVEVHLELDDAKKEWADFWHDVVLDLDDNDFTGKIEKSLDKLKVLIGVGAKAIDSEVGVLTTHTLETVEEVRKQIASAGEGGILSMFGDDSALAKETLTDYRDKLMSALTSAKEEVDNISDAYLGMLDQAQEKIDKQVEGWESIGDHIQHNIDLISLVSGEDSYDALNKQFELQYKNNLELVETQKMNKEYYAGLIEKYKDLVATTEEGSVEWKTYSQALEKASENYKAAVQSLDSTVTKAIEDLYKWKQTQIREIEDAFDKGLSGNMGLSDLEDNWNLINDSANRYLDNVERALEMEGLENEFDKALNATNLTAQAQAKLNQMRDEEISKLNQRTKLSQYDIDEVKARLELTKQEMALEDARRNKSNLRLRRDSQGNYSYQYTSDDSQVDAAEDGVLSAKKEWYQLVKKRNLDLVNEIIANRKELSAKFKELNETDWTNNEEGRKRLLDEIAKLQQREVELQSDAEKAKQDLFSGTALYFENVQNASMLPQWEATVTQLSDAWDNGGEDSFIGTIRAGIDKATSIQEDFGTKTMSILEMAGIQYENLRTKGIDPTIDSLEDLVDTNEELASQLDETNSLLDQQAIQLRDVEAAYNSLKNAAVEAIKSANDTLEQLAQTAIETQKQIQASIQATQEASRVVGQSTYTSSNSSNGGSTGGGSTLPNGKSRTVGNSYTLYSDPNGVAGTLGVYNNSSKTYAMITGDYRYLSASTIVDRLRKAGYTQQNTSSSMALRKYLASMRSGGYTGSWKGSASLDDLSAGRIALLHEKELVLNEEDTSNVLKAVNVLRNLSVDKISESIITAARASTSVLNGVGASLMQTVAGLTQNVQSGNMNNYSRNMTVNADFSGVRTADAIYQALMELDNYGMQESYSTSARANRAY